MSVVNPLVRERELLSIHLRQESTTELFIRERETRGTRLVQKILGDHLLRVVVQYLAKATGRVRLVRPEIELPNRLFAISQRGPEVQDIRVVQGTQAKVSINLINAHDIRREQSKAFFRATTADTFIIVAGSTTGILPFRG